MPAANLQSLYGRRELDAPRNIRSQLRLELAFDACFFGVRVLCRHCAFSKKKKEKKEKWRFRKYILIWSCVFVLFFEKEAFKFSSEGDDLGSGKMM